MADQPTENVDLKPITKKGHSNPERLDQVIEIFDAPSKIFIATSIASLAALISWSVLADIPSTVPAKAIFLEPYSVATLKSSGSGRYFFDSDLSAKTSSGIRGFIKLISDQLTVVMNNPNIPMAQDTQDLIISSINNFFVLSSEATSDIQVNSNSSPHPHNLAFIKEGNPIGFILNEQNALNFASQLAAFVQKDIYSNLSISSNNKLLKQGYSLNDALLQRTQTMSRLATQGVVAKSSILQARQAQIQQEQSNISQLLAVQSSKSAKKQDLTTLLGTIMSSTRGIEMNSNHNITLLSKLISSGTLVSVNQPIAIISRGSNHPNQIMCFVDGRSFSGIKRGAQVLVSPVNVDVNNYGSIIGHVEYVSPVSIGTVNARSLVGTQELTSEIYGNQQSLFLITVKLHSALTPSGYAWSSSNGPNFKIPLTTVADVQIVNKTYKPYQVILPFLRSLTGN